MTLTLLEQRIGRQLTAAETHIDILAIDALLNRAKLLLTQAIQQEQARLAALLADGHHGSLNVTPRMLSLLATLRQHGRAHATNELHSMGYPVKPVRARQLAASDDQLAGRLRRRLAMLTVKIEDATIGLSLGELAADAIHRAALDVLGARSIAADLVAPAFDAGLADTFEQHADLIDQWQYTAVMDGDSTCEPCAALDGTIYDTLAALFEVLPDFGGNPDCLGQDRCRCRAVPVPAS